MPTNDNFFNADGSRFNAADDTLELSDFTIACARAMTIHEALAKGFILPTDLAEVPCSFSQHGARGAIHCALIPEAPWARVKIGQTASTTGTDARKAKKVKLTHHEMNRRRAFLGKQSGSPKWI